jgi:DNA-binding GntR family transcriptional regulator
MMERGDGQRACLRDRIRNAVIARILDGSYPPGTRLKELALATEFGVSQGPVREALRELEVSGLAVSEPFCGTRVLGVDAAELREAYELKAAIEERAAELAVPVSAEALFSLEADLDQLQTAAGALDFEAFAVASLSFHRGIVVLSGNRAFLRAWDALHWEVRSRIAIRQAGATLPGYVEAHGEVVRALRTGDGRRAGRALRGSIDQFLAMEQPEPDPERKRGASLGASVPSRPDGDGVFKV